MLLDKILKKLNRQRKKELSKNHLNKDIAILKADLNKEYYPIEQILGGESKGLGDLYNRGLNTIKNKQV